MTTAVLLLVSAALAADPLADSHRAPVESLSGERPAESERQATLSELWQRRILPPEARDWSAGDLELLARVRSAEAAGAINFLRRRGGLSGFVTARGNGPLRLTKEGWERWRLLRTQDALKYFEAKGVDAKWGFQLRDMKDRRLFDARGLLTPEGEEVYQRALLNLPTHWKAPNGEIFGNRPSPKPAQPEAAAEPESLPRPSMPGPRRPPQANPSPVPGAPEASGAPVGGQAPPPKEAPPSQEPPPGEAPKPAP